MTLPASGPITMNQVNVELGNSGTTSISLGQSTVRALAGIPSGAISLDSLHGKSNYKYGTPTGSAGSGYVFLYINNGQPNAPFYIYLVATTSSQSVPGYIEPDPVNYPGRAYGYLDSSGNWAQSYNVSNSLYWYSSPPSGGTKFQNTFNFYQGATTYPNGTYIGQVVLSQ